MTYEATEPLPQQLNKPAVVVTPEQVNNFLNQVNSPDSGIIGSAHTLRLPGREDPVSLYVHDVVSVRNEDGSYTPTVELMPVGGDPLNPGTIASLKVDEFLTQLFQANHPEQAGATEKLGPNGEERKLGELSIAGATVEMVPTLPPLELAPDETGDLLRELQVLDTIGQAGRQGVSQLEIQNQLNRRANAYVASEPISNQTNPTARLLRMGLGAGIQQGNYSYRDQAVQLLSASGLLSPEDLNVIGHAITGIDQIRRSGRPQEQIDQLIAESLMQTIQPCNQRSPNLAVTLTALGFGSMVMAAENPFGSSLVSAARSVTKQA